MTVMTCCNTRYANVAQTLDHVCPAPAANPLFDRLMRLEEDVQVSTAIAAMGVTLRDRERAAARRSEAKSELYRLAGGLSPEDAAAYRTYRLR